MSGEELEKGGRRKSQHLSAADRVKLLQGAAGIYFFFIQYGKLQERIFQFKSPAGEKFSSVWLLQLLDALANVLVGAVGRLVRGSTPGLPQRLLLYTGLGQVLSKYCLSASLAAGLSFPVATLAKSAKMVPVMLGSFIFGGQRFTSRQVSQAAAIVGGTSLVTLSEGSGKRGNSSALGLSLVLLALACDGVVGGVQKRLKVRCREEKKLERPYDMMFWTNFYMALAAFAAAALRGELRRGLAFCRANPSIFSQIVKFSACGAMGQACIFYTIANFDSVTCTAITTTRKLVSVLISLSESDKPGLQPSGWLGLCLASGGILGEVF